MLRRVLQGLLGALLVVAAAAWGVHQITPRPAVMAIRWLFDSGAAAAVAALQKHLPSGIQIERNIAVPATTDGTAGSALDVYRPADWKPGELRPAIVWVHGGGWVSGRKEDLGPYLQVLAGQGFTTLSLDYTVAPDAHYPQQLHELNAALGFIDKQAAQLGVDRDRLVLAGDSAGAHLVAQLAAMHARADYAQQVGIVPALQRAQLRGVLLFCGPFDFSLVRLDGLFGPFLRTVVWSFFGERDAERLPAFAQASVLRHVDAAFPPAFVSAGNTDPLLPHSLALAKRLRELGVPVDELFFASDHQPPLGHEYQFNLDGEPGQTALARAAAFARAQTAAR
jgi:acetyl esterase